MKQLCKFDKKRDIVAFQPGCAPDVNLAISSGVIPDTTAETQYNGLSDVHEIGHRVREPFDVIEYDRAFSALKAKIEANKASKSK